MTQITAYKSADGTIHEKEVDAIKADAKYWQERAIKAEPYKRAAEEKDRHEPSYSGGHE